MSKCSVNRGFGARCFAAGTAALSLSLAAGCGGSEGIKNGASSPTTVIVKRDKAENAAGVDKPAAGNAGAAAAPAAAGGSGTLRGKVVFKGAPPTLEPFTEVAKIKDAMCVKNGAVPNEKLVIGEGNGVANVFIFLPKAPAGATVPPPPDTPVTFDQRGCHFIPHALFVRVGQPMKFLNDDIVTHNTHTLPARNDQFNQSILANNNTGLDYKYKKPEAKPVDVKCDIHGWMTAHHLPLEHPWGTVSGANGEFEIKDVPAGSHKFQVWHEAAAGQYLDRNLAVTIKPGEVTTIEIPYDAGKFEN
jgi:plastocyanin